MQCVQNVVSIFDGSINNGSEDGKYICTFKCFKLT